MVLAGALGVALVSQVVGEPAWAVCGSGSHLFHA